MNRHRSSRRALVAALPVLLAYPVPALAHFGVGASAPGSLIALPVAAGVVLVQALRRRVAPARAAVALLGALASAGLPFAAADLVPGLAWALEESTWFAVGIASPLLVAGTVLLWPRSR